MINRRQMVAGAGALAGLAAVSGCAAFRGGGSSLEERLRRIEATHGGRLGVAVLDSGGRLQGGHRRDERFPLLSTFKLLLAGAVLARVDGGSLRLDKRIYYPRAELVTYSPVTEKYAGSQGMTVDALCEATMTLSDNTAGNLLLRLIGGPAGLTAYLRLLGDDLTRLDRWETELNEAVPGDPRDTTTPGAMLKTMAKLTLGDALSPASRERLQGWLRGSRTGDKRLRALLPAGWSAGEKTGTGAYRTSNDAGLLWPPSGDPILVAAYLTEGSPDAAVRDAALAQVGAAVAAAWQGRRPGSSHERSTLRA
jgi:beta-lactamase class A